MDTNQYQKLVNGKVEREPLPVLRRGPITARLMPQKSRMRCLSDLFGQHFITVENSIYMTMARLCPIYQGGQWDLYMLSNGGFYMVPTAAVEWLLISEINDYQGELNAGPAGMAVTAMALNQLQFWRDGALMTSMYFLLRDYINQQPEAGDLCELID